MSESNGKAVFLSYASQDAEAARRICDTLRDSGIEVWFDADGGLEHGDEWDAKIRRQIKECVLFIPLISANTQAREEGYFRIEWDLAAERARGIASGVPFILPILIDDTREPDALVPDRFRTVQWTRLPGGVVTPEVRARYLKLWSHRTGVLKQKAMQEGTAFALPASDDAASPTATPRRWRSLMMPAIIGTLVLGAFALWRPWKKAPPPSPAAASSHATSKPGESSQLVAQIWEQLNKPELARAELEIADQLARRATDLEPNNAEAWAAWSQVDSWTIYHGFSTVAERSESARTKAARALNLAPHSFEARLAQACFLVRAVGESGVSTFATQAETALRELLRERSAEPRALLALAILLRNSEKPTETRALLEQLAKNPAFAALAFNELGWAEYHFRNWPAAEVAADRSIAIRPCWGALALKLGMALHWRGDTALAKATLDQIPVNLLQEDWGVAMACDLYLARNEPANVLRVLASASRDWLRVPLNGPSVYYAALAHAAENRSAAVRATREVALKLVEARLAQLPKEPNLLYWKGSLSLQLGQRAEGEKLLRLARELAANDLDALSQLPHPAQDHVLQGNFDEAVRSLEASVASADQAVRWGRLQFDPELKPLHNNPGYQALLRRVAADPRLSPQTKAAAQPIADPKSAAADKSLAVLPFDNLSDDKANDIFSDGISEVLINALGRVPGLTVKGRTSSFYFKQQKLALPPREMAAQLGVAYLLRGGVRKIGNTVRITAQLSRAATDEVVWASEPIKRELTDVFDVQDEIATLVARQLSLALAQPTTVSRSVSQEASLLYLQAMHPWRNRFGADYLEKLGQIETMMRRAVAIEPTFVDASARLAEVLIFREAALSPMDQAGRLRSTLEEGLRWADRAVELDPNSAEAHALRAEALTHAWRRREAEAAYQRAIGINPNFAVARARYARFLEADGRIDEGLAELEKSTQLDPLASRALDNLALMLIHAGRYTGALAAAERSLALAPDNYQALFYQAQALFHLGRKDAGMAVASKLATLEPEPFAKGDFAAYTCDLLVAQGRHEDAARFFEKISPALVADRIFAAAALGRTSVVLEVLNAHWLPSIWIDEVMWHPHFDKLRSAPEFVTWLKKTGLTEAHARAQAWRAAHPPERPAPRK